MSEVHVRLPKATLDERGQTCWFDVEKTDGVYLPPRERHISSTTRRSEPRLWSLGSHLTIFLLAERNTPGRNRILHRQA
jgi:hypothetical protein